MDARIIHNVFNGQEITCDSFQQDSYRVRSKLSNAANQLENGRSPEWKRSDTNMLFMFSLNEYMWWVFAKLSTRPEGEIISAGCLQACSGGALHSDCWLVRIVASCTTAAPTPEANGGTGSLPCVTGHAIRQDRGVSGAAPAPWTHRPAPRERSYGGLGWGWWHGVCDRVSIYLWYNYFSSKDLMMWLDSSVGIYSRLWVGVRGHREVAVSGKSNSTVHNVERNNFKENIDSEGVKRHGFSELVNSSFRISLHRCWWCNTTSRVEIMNEWINGLMTPVNF